MSTTRARPRRPPPARGWAVVVGTAVVLALAGLLALLRDPPAVGGFTSAEAYDRFDAAYRAAMAELPPPDATLDLRTGHGVVRAYRFDGPAATEPLVLLPGRASGAPMWADNLASLRAVRTVYLVDLLGEPGRSVQARPITDDADQAAWLDQALAGLPAPRVHVVGHSLGGWTAANLAIHRPDRLASVTLIDPVATVGPLRLETVVRSIPASVRWLPRSWRDAFNSWTANGAPVEHEPVAEMIEAGMQTYRIAVPQPTQFAVEELRRIPVPVLVIMAGRSVMHDAAAGADTARASLPSATVLTYPDASHAIIGEYPDRIAADVGAHLARTGP